MWLCTNYGFFSVVKLSEDRKYDGDNAPDELFAVRARVKFHLEKGFPNKKIWEYPFSDYEYRVYCTQEEVNKFFIDEVQNIDYTNFKSSVTDKKLHYFFLGIWQLGVDIFSR